MAVVNVLYNRVALDETFFCTKKWNTIDYKVLESVPKHNLLVKCNYWMGGVLEAFDKCYVSS